MYLHREVFPISVSMKLGDEDFGFLATHEGQISAFNGLMLPELNASG
jgi:hypothetical protein